MKTSATKTNQRRPFSTDEMKAIYELSINVLTVIMVVAFCGCMITSDVVNKLHLSTLYSISDWVIVINVILLALLGKPICQLLILRRDFDLIDHLGSTFDPMLKKPWKLRSRTCGCLSFVRRLSSVA